MNILLMLGPVMFSTDGTAFDAISRQWEFSWPTQQLAGYSPQPQYTGPGEQTLTITGTVLPGRYGSETTVDMIAALARLGYPLPLVAGTGEVLGCWSIRSVAKNGSLYAANGAPRKIEFTLSLVYYGLTPDAELNRKIYDKVGALPEMVLDVFT
ncbi:phage tail protein [Endozoicomonas acroporae]|uniref:phage tail protein n=1 Tax=Endozoicomonas acroporae TaxID=1701104 RepID=UPI003D78F089